MLVRGWGRQRLEGVASRQSKGRTWALSRQQKDQETARPPEKQVQGPLGCRPANPACHNPTRCSGGAVSTHLICLSLADPSFVRYNLKAQVLGTPSLARWPSPCPQSTTVWGSGEGRRDGLLRAAGPGSRDPRPPPGLTTGIGQTHTVHRRPAYRKPGGLSGTLPQLGVQRV